MTKDFVAGEQFGGYLAGVALDVAQESLVRRPAFFYLRQFRLPTPGHFHIGDVHLLHDGIQGKPFLRRHERLLHAHHVFAPEQGLDDGGTGGGCADAAVLHCLTQRVVLNFLASRFHRGQQGGFGMQRLGFGLSLRDGGGFQCQRVAFLPTGNGGGFLLAVVLFSILLAIDGTPSGLPDDAAFCHELHSGTLCRDGGSVLDAFFGESLKHAPGYHVIDGAVLFGEEQRLLARDEQGMVVCHLG